MSFKANNPFKTVKVNRPGRSVFDLSHRKLLSAKMGVLYPVLVEEVMPGDYFNIGHEIVVRCLPLVAPILHEVNVYAHSFFVPTRLLVPEFQEFITKGVSGNEVIDLPRWDNLINTFDYDVGSLWDYLGFPPGVQPAGCMPLDTPRRAYVKIWNDHYRDNNLQEEIDITDQEVGSSLLFRNYEKDYFTAAQLSQQRGTAVSLPLTGQGNAEWILPVHIHNIDTTPPGGTQVPGAMPQDNDLPHGTEYQLADGLNDNTVDMAGVGTFTAPDMRLLFQVQRWAERNQRCGVRYPEFLKSHFGISPTDETLQRAVYIGGYKAPLIISETLQTSETSANSPQGNLAGHGISVGQTFAGKYLCKEFGIIMTLLSIMPRTTYTQGIEKSWLRETPFDFPFPEFANLSERAIVRAELFANGTANDNNTVFGFTGMYDELRQRRSTIHGQMRSVFDYWHISRYFSEAPELNEDFIKCVPDPRPWAVQNTDQFIVNVGNLIKAIRPIPTYAEPGLLDH